MPTLTTTDMSSPTLPPVILDERVGGWGGNKGGGFFKNKAFRVLLGATLPLIFLLLSNFRSLLFLDHLLPDDDDNNVHQQQYQVNHHDGGLSFAVVGFPKAGTSFLLKVLGQHPEIVMPKQEFCNLHQKDGANKTQLLLKEMMTMQQQQPSSSSKEEEPRHYNIKYGIKCPTMVRNTNAIDNLAEMSNTTRLIIGLRHPVLFFQSFYNYRVMEHYHRNRTTPIPSPLELTDGSEKTFNDVHVAYARYDIFLMQLAKVPLNPSELNRMMRSDQVWPKRISPNPFQIFIYTDTQLKQGNTSIDLKHFLGLELPLPDMKSQQKANVGASHPFPETINICDAQFDNIRNELLQYGKESSRWISEKFIESKDVTVSDKTFFIESLRTWGDDPCASDDR